MVAVHQVVGEGDLERIFDGRRLLDLTGDQGDLFPGIGVERWLDAVRKVDEPPASRGNGGTGDAGGADAAKRERGTARDEWVARLGFVRAGSFWFLAKVDRDGQRRARLKIDVFNPGIELADNRRQWRALGLLVMDAAHDDIDELLFAGHTCLKWLRLVLDLIQIGRLVHMLV